MNPAHISALVSAASALLMLGFYIQSTREHERRLNELDEEQGEQWSHIGQAESGIANLRGQLGLNGK